MEVLIGITAVFSVLWLWIRFGRSSALNRLTDAGAVRRPLSDESRHSEYIGLATVGNHTFENSVRARLTEDGVVVSFKKEGDEVVLPFELLTVTGNKWTHPLRFGVGKQEVGMNLGQTVPADAVQKMKDKKCIQPGQAG